MADTIRRRWQLNKVRTGDGSLLKDYRLWQAFSRSLFFLDLATPEGGSERYAVDVRHLAEEKTRRQHEDGVGRSPAALYRDGAQVYRSNLPSTFPVPGGVIEVATSSFGLKRMRLVTEDGAEHALRPHPHSPEGLRERFDRAHPRASAVVGAVAVLILVVVLTVTLLQTAETVTASEVIAERVGTFTSPVSLPTWGNVTMGVVGVVAAVERSLRLRYHWLLDSAAS